MIPGSGGAGLWPIASGGFAVDNSAVFNDDDSEYLTRTPSVTGNVQTWTISFWYKMGSITGRQMFYGQNNAYISINENSSTSALINMYIVGNDSPGWYWETTQVFRDPHAWYHIVVAFDSTHATTDSRLRLYINGGEVTSFTKHSTGAQHNSHDIGGTSTQIIAKHPVNSAQYLDGYLAEYCYVNGTQLAPTSFGETDDNGVWRPIDISAQSLTFGTNGFYLPFTNSAGLGQDYSGTTSETKIQENTYASGSEVNKGDMDTAGHTAGAKLTAIASAALPTVKIRASATGFTSVTVRIETDSGSGTAPSGTLVDSNAEVTGITSAGAGLKTATFPNGGPILVAGTTYWIVLAQTGNWGWQHDVSGSGGTLGIRDGSGYQAGRGLGHEAYQLGNIFTPANSPAQSADSPTKNYAVISPLLKHSSSNALSNGNRILSSSSNGWFGAVGSTAIRYGEKRYFEAKCLTNVRIYFGLSRVLNHNGQDITDSAVVEGSANFDYMWRTTQADTIYYQGSNQSATVSAVSVNDIVSCTTETNGTVKFYKNGTLVHTFSTVLVDGDVYHPIFSVNGASSTEQVQANFGSGDVTQQESGYTLLEAADLHSNDPVGIEDGSAYFQATGYSGNDGANEINQSGNSTFQPDLVWLKERQGNHGTLIDAVRGGNKGIYPSLSSQGEYTESNLSFDADGFSLTTTGAAAQVNASGNTNMGWQWLAGNGTSTPSGGSIASTVSVNQDAGFSIVSWTGSGANATIAHGLGSTPKWIIIKNRDSAQHVAVYSSEIPNGQYLLLSDTGASSGSSGAAHFNDSQPDATIFPVGTSARTNGSSQAMIAWCWCEKPGFSRFGSFEGNGQSANGPFIELGFKPAFFMWKNIDSGTNGDWTMMDNFRDPFNMVEDNLRANSTMASDTGEADLDFLSNGVRHRGGASERFNTDNQTYFYMAFAEHPFAGTSPTTAR